MDKESSCIFLDFLDIDDYSIKANPNGENSKNTWIIAGYVEVLSV